MCLAPAAQVPRVISLGPYTIGYYKDLCLTVRSWRPREVSGFHKAIWIKRQQDFKSGEYLIPVSTGTVIVLLVVYYCILTP